MTFVFGYGFDPFSPTATFTNQAFLRSESTPHRVKISPENPESPES